MQYSCTVHTSTKQFYIYDSRNATDNFNIFITINWVKFYAIEKCWKLHLYEFGICFCLFSSLFLLFSLFVCFSLDVIFDVELYFVSLQSIAFHTFLNRIKYVLYINSKHSYRRKYLFALFEFVYGTQHIQCCIDVWNLPLFPLSYEKWFFFVFVFYTVLLLLSFAYSYNDWE